MTEPFTYIDIASVNNRTKQIENPQLISSNEAPSRARQIVAANDVLVSTVRPGLNAVALVPVALGGAIASTGFTVLRPGPELDSKFLFHYVQSTYFVDYLISRATGASYPAVSDKIVKACSIPLPPMSEQRRIASLLDEGKNFVESNSKRAVQLIALHKSEFSRIADRVDTALPLIELVSIRSGNLLPEGEKYAGQPNGSLLLRVSDLNHPMNSRQVTVGSNWNSNEMDKTTSAPAGSVVFPKRGGAILTNKKRILLRAAHLDPNLMGLVPKDDRCPTEWLAAWLDTVDLGTLANGSSVPQINKKDVKDLMVPVPSVEHLQSFRRISQKIGHLQNVVQQQAASARELYDSLQYHAFRGEV